MQKKVPELWIRERRKKKRFEECFSACSGVRQKMRAEKLRKVAGKYIYKRVFEENFFTRNGVYGQTRSEKLQKMAGKYIYKRDYKYI